MTDHFTKRMTPMKRLALWLRIDPYMPTLLVMYWVLVVGTAIVAVVVLLASLVHLVYRGAMAAIPFLATHCEWVIGAGAAVLAIFALYLFAKALKRAAR